MHEGLLFFGLLVLVDLNAQAIALVVTAGISDVKLGTAVACVPLMLNDMFAGFFVRVSSMPVCMRWLRHIMVIRYAFVGFVENQFRGQVFPGCPDLLETALEEAAAAAAASGEGGVGINPSGGDIGPMGPGGLVGLLAAAAAGGGTGTGIMTLSDASGGLAAAAVAQAMEKMASGEMLQSACFNTGAL